MTRIQQNANRQIEAAAQGLVQRPTVTRIALTRSEAAAALGMSLDSFERHIQPELRLVRRGSLRLVPIKELERWVEQNAEAVLPRRA